MKLLKSIFLTLMVATIITSGATTKGYAETSVTANYSLAASTSQTVGTTFPVTIYEDSGASPVNIWQVELNYDSSKLQYVGIDDSTDGFTNAYKPQVGSTRVKFARFNVAPQVGKVALATVNFKALTSIGSTTVSFGSNNIILDTDHKNIWDTNSSAITISFSPQVVPAPKPAKVSAAPTVSASQPVAPAPPKQSTLGAETAKPDAQTTHTDQTAATTPSETTAVLNFEGSHASGTSYLAAAYLFAITLLAGSLVAVKRRYNLRKQS